VVDCHGASVHDVAFSRDGKLVASASADRTVKVWETASAQVIRTFEGHSDWITAVLFSWDITMVVSASVDRTIRLWDLRTGFLIKLINVVDNSRIPEVLFTAQEQQPEAEAGEKRICIQPTERFISRLAPLFLDGNWVTHEGKKLLFLPAEYRPY
jgi:WD40 repeat protein